MTNLESMERFVNANERNYREYRRGLGQPPGFSLMAYNVREKRTWQYVVVDMEEKAAGMSRDEVVRALHAENVLARWYFYPGAHRMEPYRSHFPHAQQIETICQILRFLYEHGPDVQKVVVGQTLPAAAYAR